MGGVQLPLLTPSTDWSPPATLPDLRDRPRLAIDVETEDRWLSRGRGAGWPYGGCRVVGVSVAWDEPDGGYGSLYVPTGHPEDNYREPGQVGPWLRDIAGSAGRVVFQNAPYDIGSLSADPNFLMPVPSVVDDTIAAATTVNEDRFTYGLDDLCKWRGIEGKDESLLREAAAAFGFDPKAEMHKLPARFVGAYAAQDPRATLALLDSLRPDLDAESTYEAYRLECDLIPVVHAMRRRGIRLDVDRAERAATKIDALRDRVLAEMARRLGIPSATIEQCRSNATLVGWFNAEGINYPMTRPTRGHPNGQPSFTADWMRGHPHWLPRMVSRAEQLNEASNKFLRSWLIGFSHRGRLHAEVNQYRTEEGRGTKTFRFSYSDPPLQQMPMRDPHFARIIRGCFMGEPGQPWTSADYSQQEYRLMVHFAAALGLRGAREAAARYVDDPDTDFHLFVAELTGLERKPAKDCNFAKSYGAGTRKFAAMTGRSEEEAEDIMRQYDLELPFPKLLSERCQSLARSRGYIRMLDGARAHFDKWEPDRSARSRVGYAGPFTRDAAERWQSNVELTQGWRPGIERAFTKDAMNRLIQGSAARQTKLAMRECWREGILPHIQMHDELGCSFGSAREAERLSEIMRGVVELRVPMKVDLEHGRDWGDAGKRSWADALARVRK